MTPKMSSFYLPSPDDLYKDLCRELPNDLYDLHWHDNPAAAGGGGLMMEGAPDAARPTNSSGLRKNRASSSDVTQEAAGFREFHSDLYDMQWHKHQIESLDSSTYSGTLRSFTAPSQSGDLRIISVECLSNSPGIDFEDWYVSAVDPSGGEKLYKAVHDENLYYILFESAEDASLVYEFLRTALAGTQGYKTSLCTIENARIMLSPTKANSGGAGPMYGGSSENLLPASEGGVCGMERNTHQQPPQCCSASAYTGGGGFSNEPPENFDQGNYYHQQQSVQRRQSSSINTSSDSLSNPAQQQGRFVGSDPRCSSGVGLLGSSSEPEEKNSLAQTSRGRIIHLILAQNTCLDKVIDMMSRFGKINKIIMFTKDTSIQALIEYADERSASRSVRECDLSGMSVQFSRLSELKIQQNNNRAWDFTLAPTRVISARSSSPISLISIGFNEILSMKKLPKEMRDWLKSVSDYYNPASSSMGPPTTTDLCCEEQQSPSPGPFGNVIIVYNLSCNSINELFNIFSIYGVCTRVKFLRQKDSCALIQYSDPVYASFAKYFLSHTNLWTSPGLQISYSKIDNVKLGQAAQNINNQPTNNQAAPQNQPVDLMSRAYTQSEQRFCEVPKYGNCVSFPSETIFIASIADVTPKARLLELFGSVGKVLAHDLRPPYSGGPKKPHMLLQYADVETALRAIATFHNLILDGSQIKIAFSKVRLIR